MKNNGSFFITTGLLLIAAALCITLFNAHEANAAGDAASEIAAQLTANTPQPTAPQAPSQNEAESVLPNNPQTPVSPEPTQPQQEPLYELYPEMEMPAVKIDGQTYLGILKIPALDLELPVMKDWSYPKLKIAPCRYSGSAYQDNLVIMAHNYKQHFGQIKNLKQGDAVTFTDIDGNVFRIRLPLLNRFIPQTLKT